MRNKKGRKKAFISMPAVLVLALVLTPAGCGKQAGDFSRTGQQEEEGTAAGGYVSPEGDSDDGVRREEARESTGTDTEGAGAEASDPSGEITLIMVGDILLHTPVAESGRREDGSYDFSAVFAEMKEEISGADLALVNQEVIIGGAELGVSGYPAFNAPFELGDALADAGFDVVLHATNHALDKGERGITNCLSFWRENYPDMAVLGIHDSGEDGEEIYVYEQEGIRIAILNYTYGTNGIPLPKDMPYAVDLLNKERVESDLERAREMADFVVVCPHWGTEYTLSVTQEQRDWAVLFAENGADLVLGTHPHVIEPIEWEESGEGALVCYSLGNFVNWTSESGEGIANRMVGGMVRVTIGRDDRGKVLIRNFEVEPLICHLEQGFGGVTVYPLKEYTEELAGLNEIIKQDGNFSLRYCQELAEEVFRGYAAR